MDIKKILVPNKMIILPKYGFCKENKNAFFHSQKIVNISLQFSL